MTEDLEQRLEQLARIVQSLYEFVNAQQLEIEALKQKTYELEAQQAMDRMKT